MVHSLIVSRRTSTEREAKSLDGCISRSDFKLVIGIGLVAGSIGGDAGVSWLSMFSVR